MVCACYIVSVMQLSAGILDDLVGECERERERKREGVECVCVCVCVCVRACVRVREYDCVCSYASALNGLCARSFSTNAHAPNG